VEFLIPNCPAITTSPPGNCDHTSGGLTQGADQVRQIIEWRLWVIFDRRGALPTTVALHSAAERLDLFG
jgi:hypothetical protein